MGSLADTRGFRWLASRAATFQGGTTIITCVSASALAASRLWSRKKRNRQTSERVVRPAVAIASRWQDAPAAAKETRQTAVHVL